MILLEFFNPSQMGTGDVRLAFAGLHLNKATVSTILLWLAVAFFVGADVMLMKAALTKAWGYIAAGMFLSCAANWLYLSVIEQHGLAAGFLIVTALMTLGTVGAGIALFSESWSLQKSAAVVLLLMAAALLSVPESQPVGGE